MPLNVRWLLMLLAVLWWNTAVLAASAPDDVSAEDHLIAQIRLGESLFRDDIVEDAVDRLFRIRPEHPVGLAAQAELALRHQDFETARARVDRLQATAPDSDATREAATLLRLATSAEAGAALSEARLYAAAGRLAEARQQYDEVFQGVYPSADFQLEYWQFRARSPADRPLALDRIRQALSRYPEHVGLLAAAARLSLSAGQDAQGLAYLHRLADLPAGHETASRMEYDFLAEQKAVSPDSVAAWRAYAKRYADLPRAGQAQARADQQQALLDDPAWRAGRDGMALIDADRDTPRALADLQRAVAAYPEEPDFLGALGLAWLRSGDRVQALRYFELARTHEAQVGGAAAWVSLIESTRYWLLLERADQAAARGDWTQAQSLYAQAHAQEPDNLQALLGLADVAAAREQTDRALALYQQAFRRDPDNGAAQRGMIRVLKRLPADEALARLAVLGVGATPAGVALRHELILDQHVQRARRAESEKDWVTAEHEWAAAQALDPDDPWTSYHRASALQAQGADEADVMRAYQVHLARHPRGVESRYAQALLLSAASQRQAALDALAVVDSRAWTEGMRELSTRLHRQIRLDRAQRFADAGDLDQAQAVYAAILRDEPAQPDAYLAQMQLWAARGDWPHVKTALEHLPDSLQTGSRYQRSDLADLWFALGNRDAAIQTLQASLTSLGADPLLYRNLARLDAVDDEQKGLATYAAALRAAKLLPGQVDDPVDPAALTQATRAHADDDWLARSIRRETAALYQQQNPQLNVVNDYWFRNDGTPGMSRLHANTTITRLDFPLQGGRAYLQADHVRMDTGTLETDASGQTTDGFGSCRLGDLPGCSDGLRQTAVGTGIALGYQGEHLAFDVGHSPFGFKVDNWLGGVSYADDLGQIGWRLTFSRRPLSSSLLSYAGARDPRTGIVWGGVVATGPSLSLSWDQGEANGVWADLSAHKLTGRNVADNTRVRLMGGYYRRLINETDRVLTVGVNGMAWHYQKDLGEYTLGQGGYYSPQRYLSLSLPVRWAQRTADWSFVIDASVSRSWTRSRESPYYPLSGLLAGIPNVSPAALDSRMDGGSGGGVGYSVHVAAERRLNARLVLGASFEVQKSRDYSPNRAMLYLRYSFKPWKGDLPVPISPLSAYSEFK